MSIPPGAPVGPEALKILYLAPSVPSISYRAWAHNLRGFTPLRWLCDRLTARYGNANLVIACHDDCDRDAAQPIADHYGLLIAVCQGNSLLQALGDLVRIEPSRPLACFHPEAMFAPEALLDRALDHHVRCRNHFTCVPDIPDLLGPQIIESDLARALAALSFTGGIPSPREVVSRLARPDLRAVAYLARPDFGTPPCDDITPFAAPEDVDRARQAVAVVQDEPAWGAVERWKAATYIAEPLALSTRLRPARAFASCTCPREPSTPARRNAFAVWCSNWRNPASNRPRSGSGKPVCPAPARSRMRSCGGGLQPAHFGPRFGGAGLRCSEALDCPCQRNHRRRISRGSAGTFRARGSPRPDSGLSRHHQAPRRGSSDCRLRFRTGAAHESRHKSGENLAGIRRCRHRTIRAGLFDKQACRTHFDLPRDAFVALMIARPTPSKRHDLMLDAFTRLLASGVDARLVFVGDFGDAAFFHEMQIKAHHMEIHSRVSWLPFQHDIRPIECAADVIALPSDFEALGMCSLEAMALEIPAIVSDSGGGRELIQHDVSGLIMRGGDAGSWLPSCNCSPRTRICGAGLAGMAGAGSASSFPSCAMPGKWLPSSETFAALQVEVKHAVVNQESAFAGTGRPTQVEDLFRQ